MPILELGSGAGFAKEIIPEIITTDIVPYPKIDYIINAEKLPFEDNSLRAICMFNVFHHIPNVESFLTEAQRCLAPGGRILIIDQYWGWFVKIILKYFHHEDYLPESVEWGFESNGPLTGANGALAWIVFVRDREKFKRLFPNLKINSIVPHTPLRYWLVGGLKNWCLLPPKAFPIITKLDKFLTKRDTRLASFVNIEIEKLD